MPEIYNLSTVCRCCHVDGSFKSLKTSYRVRNTLEIYETMLEDVLGITIHEPPLEVSYSICDKCIIKLRQAANFKKQVLLCEQKFVEYCRNEQFVNADVKVKFKTELYDEEEIVGDNRTETEDNYKQDSDYKQELKEDLEVDFQHPDDISCADDNITIDFKEEQQPTTENKENETKDNKANDQLKEDTNKDENETQDYEIDTSGIIEQETENGLQYSCKDCSGVHYFTKKLIYRHVHTNHGSLKCKFCGKQLKSFMSYENHIRIHSEKKYGCTECNKKYHVKAALNAHMKTHTKEKNFICDICKKAFTFKNVLKRHIIWHQGLNKKALCELCGRSFNDTANLRSHVLTVHEKQRPFRCDVCPKTFTAKKHLKAHQAKHDNTQTTYPCDVCDRIYSTSQAMNFHRLSHDDLFRCRHCAATFKGRETYLLHIKSSHRNKNVFPCHECGKILSSKYALRRHLKEKSGLKKHACDVCGKMFSQRSIMIRHKDRIHNPKTIEKIKCSICEKRFSNIASHMRSHDDRKFACDMCPKTYSENKTLTRHKIQAHYGRTFDCVVCGKKYMQKSKLNTHIVKVHKMKIEVEVVDKVEQSA